MIRSRFGSRRGSAVLEAALTFGAILFLIIGTLDIGRILFMHQTLTERASHAVRWAAVHEYNETNIKNMVLYRSVSPAESAEPVFGLGTDNVFVTRETGVSGAPDRVRVRISGWTYQFLSPYIAGDVVAPDIVTSMTMENP